MIFNKVTFLRIEGTICFKPKKLLEFDPNFEVPAPKILEIINVNKISKTIYEILSFLQSTKQLTELKVIGELSSELNHAIDFIMEN